MNPTNFIDYNNAPEPRACDLCNSKKELNVTIEMTLDNQEVITVVCNKCKEANDKTSDNNSTNSDGANNV